MAKNTRIMELIPSKIKYQQMEQWAVFRISKPPQSEFSELVKIFDSPSYAATWIKDNHREGFYYFICEGFCMG